MEAKHCLRNVQIMIDKEQTTAKLIEYYQKQVDAIPSVRPIQTLMCETMLKIIESLEKNHNPNDNFSLLVKSSEIASGDDANSSIISTAIMLWKNSKNS